MKGLGIIFSNIHDKNLPELTKTRTIASVPFGARYRMVDFVLSGMKNAGIEDIGIITKTKYHSLMSHVGSGKDWDLNRNNGGVSILAPFFEAGSGPLYSNRMEALMNSVKYIQSSEAEFVVMSDCDLVCNFPYKDMIDYFEETNADVVAAYQNIHFNRYTYRYSQCFEIDEDNNIVGVTNHTELLGNWNFCPNIWVIRREFLLDLIRDAGFYGYHSFSRESLPHVLEKITIKAFNFRGYLAGISSLEDYYQCNLDLLNPKIRKELFQNEQSPVFTRVLDSAPTKYGPRVSVRNSMISDGCVINGTVENSIIFRGVRVEEGAVVKNSILMQNSIIGSGAEIDSVITEKNVVIQRDRRLSGCSNQPFFIGAGKIV